MLLEELFPPPPPPPPPQAAATSISPNTRTIHRTERKFFIDIGLLFGDDRRECPPGAGRSTSRRQQCRPLPGPGQRPAKRGKLVCAVATGQLRSVHLPPVGR